MDRLIAQDADLIDVPAMTDVEKIAESGTTKEQALAAVRNHLKGLPND